MSASWPRSTSAAPSVNGTVKTVGRVPPASWAVNVGPVHSYSWVVTSMSGCSASNWRTWSSNASNAACSLPGFRLTTVIAVLPSGVVGCSPPLLLHAARPVSTRAAAAAAAGLRMDLIVVPLPGAGLRGPQPRCGVGGQQFAVEVAAGQQDLVDAGERDGPVAEVDHAGEPVAAGEREHVVRGGQPPHRPAGQLGAPDAQRGPVQREH